MTLDPTPGARGKRAVGEEGSCGKKISWKKLLSSRSGVQSHVLAVPGVTIANVSSYSLESVYPFPEQTVLV
jgi:hypothetical protein